MSPPPSFTDGPALELHAADPFVFRPAELRQVGIEIRRALEACNVCLVARRSRLRLVESSLGLRAGGGEVAGIVEVGVGSQMRELRFAAALPGLFVDVQLERRSHVLDTLRLVTRGGHALRIGLPALLALSDAAQTPLTDMQVEYVGRMPEDDGHGDVVERLVGGSARAGHEPLRAALGELEARHGDHDVHLLLFSFELLRRHAMAAARAHIDRVTRGDLAEAALLHYFVLLCNERPPASWPDATRATLDRAAALGFTAVAVSLSTMEQGFRLHSRGVAASDAHAMRYPIATSEHRRAFLTSHAPAP
ncbi:hypothetical protein [Caldimonas sp. KR1-144]|uniref:hypothetical protein n=1 Tax=Caldimonas sp. KR1-144 TaxID=3400911 RepID=UPI003C03CAAE